MKNPKRQTRILLFIFALSLLLLGTVGCEASPPTVRFQYTGKTLLTVGETVQLSWEVQGDGETDPSYPVTFHCTGDAVTVDREGRVTALAPGQSEVTVTLLGAEDRLVFTVQEAAGDSSGNETTGQDPAGGDEPEEEITLTLSVDTDRILVGEKAHLTLIYQYGSYTPVAIEGYDLIFTQGSDCVVREGKRLTATAPGTVRVQAKFRDVLSNTLLLTVEEENTPSTTAPDTSAPGSDPGIPTPEDLWFVLSADRCYLLPGEKTLFSALVYPAQPGMTVSYEILEGQAFGRIENGFFVATAPGDVKVCAHWGQKVSTELWLHVVPDGALPRQVILTVQSLTLRAEESTELWVTVYPQTSRTDAVFYITEGADNVLLIGNRLVSLNGGPFTVVAEIGGVRSQPIRVNDAPAGQDPYINMSKETFYSNYKPAESYKDAYYRTLHNFMSGSLADQMQEPTVAKNRPVANGMFVRNTDAYYTDDGHTYCVVNAQGQVVNRIYKEGAYITLEEVAAYLFAFGDVPPNYVSGNNMKPTSSPWGKYLRLNHREFSGNTDRYPYEPVLPRISGCGGDLTYYEVDIGTTGTDCDPSYPSVPYNDGKKITRGAARIVYVRFDRYGDPVTDPDERYLFYTYNHYNDFQEYLNYQGGWGEKFGNITGGGTLSSKHDYNPTDYVPTARAGFLRAVILPFPLPDSAVAAPVSAGSSFTDDRWKWLDV